MTTAIMEKFSINQEVIVVDGNPHQKGVTEAEKGDSPMSNTENKTDKQEPAAQVQPLVRLTDCVTTEDYINFYKGACCLELKAVLKTLKNKTGLDSKRRRKAIEALLA